MSSLGYELPTWPPQFDDRCQIRKPTLAPAEVNGRVGSPSAIVSVAEAEGSLLTITMARR